MIAIFSNWSNSGNLGFGSQNDYVLSLALAAKYAKKIFGEVHFYGDRQSISLIEGKVAFDKTFDSLEALNSRGIPYISAYPRAYVYSLMDQPFVHINSDVYIWEPLPEKCLNAEVFCQGIEYDFFNKGIDQLKQSGFIGNALWEEYVLNKSVQFVPRMEIFGGQNIEWIRKYASDILHMIECPANLVALKRKMFSPQIINIALEQWYNVVRSYYDEIFITTLCSDDKSCPIKYTHFISDAKKDHSVLSVLRARCNKEFPDLMMKLLYGKGA